MALYSRKANDDCFRGDAGWEEVPCRPPRYALTADRGYLHLKVLKEMRMLHFKLFYHVLVLDDGNRFSIFSRLSLDNDKLKFGVKHSCFLLEIVEVCDVAKLFPTC